MFEEVKEKQKELKIFNLENQPISSEEEYALLRCRAFPMRHNFNRRWVNPFSYAVVIIVLLLGVLVVVKGNPDMMVPCFLIVNVLWISIVIKECRFEAIKKLT